MGVSGRSFRAVEHVVERHRVKGQSAREGTQRKAGCPRGSDPGSRELRTRVFTQRSENSPAEVLAQSSQSRLASRKFQASSTSTCNPGTI